MDYKLPLTEIKTPEDVAKLVGAISELADSLDTLYSETAPNSAISGRVGQLCLYKSGSTYTTWICVGSTVWQQIDADTGIPLTYLDTDGTLAANSDVKVASQKATKTYADTGLGTKQATLVSGTNIKTINSVSLLGSGDIVTPSLSNVIFSFGLCADTGATYGFSTWALVGNFAGTVSQAYWCVKGTSYQTILRTKFKKIAGISTITIYAFISTSNSGSTTYCNTDIGGQALALSQVITTLGVGEWKNGNIDVSSLTNGTVYDVVVQLKGGDTNHAGVLYSIIGIAS